MRTPANAIADTIVGLEADNEMLEIQVASFKQQAIDFQAKLDQNLATIAELEPHAVWADTPMAAPVTEQSWLKI